MHVRKPQVRPPGRASCSPTSLPHVDTLDWMLASRCCVVYFPCEIRSYCSVLSHTSICGLQCIVRFFSSRLLCATESEVQKIAIQRCAQNGEEQTIEKEIR